MIVQSHDCSRLSSGLMSRASSEKNVAINIFNELLQDIINKCFDYLDQIEILSHREEAGKCVLAMLDSASNDGGNDSSFDIRNISSTTSKFIQKTRSSGMCILIDEWAAIPKNAQPYVAELFKRVFFNIPEFSVKIASVSHQQKFSLSTDDGVIGIETGADMFSNVDLDKHFVWEEDEAGASSFFAQMLYNHLAKEGGLSWVLDVTPPQKQATILSLFTQENAFNELCRATGGNCRDCLNIFINAHAEHLRREGDVKISIPSVKRASETWYRTDKLRHIQSSKPKLEDFLNYLIQNIIRDKRSKTFMVSYKDINHPILLDLFSARLLHPTQIVWSHPDQPGEPYHLVTIDYGCYVSIKGSSATPSQMFIFPTHNESEDEIYDDLVPYDDRRSIRRIVVTRNDLDRFQAACD